MPSLVFTVAVASSSASTSVPSDDSLAVTDAYLNSTSFIVTGLKPLIFVKSSSPVVLLNLASLAVE